mgnify:CR=1 FL=1
MANKKNKENNLHLTTKMIRGGTERSPFDETSEALFMTSGYVYSSPEEAQMAFEGEKDRFLYSRYANPTVSMLEERLRLLEGARHCKTTASGMAAVFASLACQLKKGDRIVASRALFSSCLYIIKDILPIINAAPEVVSHNIETVRRLTRKVRIQAKYDRSLQTLDILFRGGMRTKSGIMLGLGESEQEVIETMRDLRSVGVVILTLGQYLQPSKKHLPVLEFVKPEQFNHLKSIALSLGFKYVESGPLVRSSYHAEKHLV